MGEREMIERLRDKLPGIQTPMMNGDNLAITLCSHFDNPNQQEDEFGWSKDAVRGQYEVLDAIHAHYATTIASLSEALAEAEKKGADEKDEAVRMCAVLEVLVMQRDRHFHTAKAWDEARAVLRAYSKDSSDGE